MKYILLFILLGPAAGIFAQKPPIDTSVLKKWAGVYGGTLSPDGSYAIYTIYGQPPGTRRLVIQSTRTDWKKELTRASAPRFSHDSRWLIFRTGGDSLCLLGLGREEMRWIAHAREYTLSEEGNWLACQLSMPANELLLRNLTNEQERHFAAVTNYLFVPGGKDILLQTKTARDSLSIWELLWAGLSGGETRRIGSGPADSSNPVSYCFDSKAEQLAFLMDEKKDSCLESAIWYYKEGMETAQLLVDSKSPGIEKNWKLTNNELAFSENGRRIFLGIKPMEQKLKPKAGAVSVDIWSYNDPELQSIQQLQGSSTRSYAAVWDIDEKRVIRLEQEGESIAARTNDYALVSHSLSNSSLFESNWNTVAQRSVSLVSLRDGSRKLIRDHLSNPHEGAAMSPGGKWILYYDFIRKDFFSYETATGKTRNITKGSRAHWEDPKDEHPEPELAWVPWRNTWLADDSAVLIYDLYDIWRVDPSGVHAPVNLTGGYGRAHSIKFELIDEGSSVQRFSREKNPVIGLKAVNNLNKDRGFYRVSLTSPGNPEKLFMGPYVFGDWDGYYSYNYPPVKARDTNAWLVTRMSAVESPDYFVTTDFKNFHRLSRVQPQESYNWLRTELVNWTNADGSSSMGVLYKPEDFDPGRKYPLIFDYYEKRSDELNLYLSPGFSQSSINIPWFVSNGYLVFTPDIHYKMGEPGKSALRAVAGAAAHLGKLTWVDMKRMGIQGHSFGGYETNYIVTHTAIFAAACSASGISDLISFYGADARGGFPIYWAERSQGRLGATPWQMPSLYLSNSPIMQADKVTTPLLLINNKGDETVPFSQGVELFTALRRLGKKVWMLQYDGERHSLDRGRVAADYHFRMVQFFDHYLKGLPAPKWMTRGIPASRKQIEDGMELDTDK